MRSGAGEVVFRNGSVFDGTRFSPAGAWVRIGAGRIPGVGPAGRPGAAEPVDLGGGTLLPGLIDAHAHPVFADHQLRCCDPEAALAAWTSGSARVNGLESAAGAIRAGFDADFAVVDADLSALPPGEIFRASVRQTWAGGKLAYERRGRADRQQT